MATKTTLEGVDLTRMKKGDIVAWAEEQDIALDPNQKKDDMIAEIGRVLAERETTPTRKKAKKKTARKKAAPAHAVAENGDPQRPAEEAPADEAPVEEAPEEEEKPPSFDEKLEKIMKVKKCKCCGTVDRWEDLAKAGPVRTIKCMCGGTDVIDLS